MRFVRYFQDIVSFSLMEVHRSNVINLVVVAGAHSLSNFLIVLSVW